MRGDSVSARGALLETITLAVATSCRLAFGAVWRMISDRLYCSIQSFIPSIEIFSVGTILGWPCASGLLSCSRFVFVLVFLKPAMLPIPRHRVRNCLLQYSKTQAKLLFTLAVVKAGTVLLPYQ